MQGVGGTLEEGSMPDILCAHQQQGASRAASGLLQISLFWCKLSPASVFREVIPSFTVEGWGSRKTNQSSSDFNLPNSHLTYI